VLLLATVLAAAGLCSGTATAQLAKPPSAIVLVQPTGQDTMLVIAFSKTEPHSRARERVRELARRTGASITSLTVKDTNLEGSAPRPGEKDVQTDVEATLTNVSFALGDAFLLQPLVEVMKDTGRFDIMFVVPPQNGFAGLRRYEEKGFLLQLAQEGNPYTYKVLVERGLQDVPQLPLRQPAEAPRSQPPPRQEPRSWEVIVLVALAAGVGIGVFALMRKRAAARLSRDEAQ